MGYESRIAQEYVYRSISYVDNSIVPQATNNKKRPVSGAFFIVGGLRTGSETALVRLREVQWTSRGRAGSFARSRSDGSFGSSRARHTPPKTTKDLY